MDDKNKNSEPTSKNTDANYNPTNRDFQRTEEETDSISASEKEEQERTERGNTEPDKNKIA